MVQETGREAPTGFLNERDRAPPTTRVKTEVFHTLAAAQRNEQPYGGGGANGHGSAARFG
jgi:hypothetical protein